LTDPHPDIGLDDMITWLNGRKWSVETWLRDHSAKRGKMDVDQKMNDLRYYQKLVASFAAMKAKRDAA